MNHVQVPHQHPLLAQLATLPLDAIAVATCFVRRTPRGITPLAFLAALCLEATGSTPTLAMCAVRAALVSVKSVSREAKVPVRLVALPVPAQVAAKRRRALNCNRDRRCNPSAAHRALMNWAIFITSVPAHRLPADQIAELYGLRWRIETIFKIRNFRAITVRPCYSGMNMQY